MNRAVRAEPTPPECALAAEMFDHFCSAGTMKQILALHREICNTLTLKPNRLPDFYPKLKAKLVSSWKAQALFKKFDARANHKVYGKGRACAAGKVLLIGAGPCGLRAAIECQLLGAKVVVIEKRDRMSRNNVLHLWPFVIQDLRALGAKKFFGKFCAGSIDHISIRQLQCILLKVALLLGVEFHEGVSFEELLEPTVTENGETLGWRARVMPAEHPVAQYEFDALIGADGKRNTLHGFKRKEFRGKLAMAITANFINRHSEQEASVPEISGVAFIFNQKFFKELYEVTGIDLENIVYYKDDTHYFVMTAKKHSLLDKGVLLNDYAEVSRLLSVENVDRAALMRYAQEAARFSTDGRLPLRDFALNHYGEPDVALFDFTSMYAAENASMVYERHGRRLLCQLVGDSLLEPFWPTGSGCARGFLSALDAAWAVRGWGQAPAPHPLTVIAERESIYRLLAQTTPENLHRDFGGYTLDPGTRYPNLNRGKVTPLQVTSFYDSDEPLPLDAAPAARKRRRETEITEEALVRWVGWGEAGLRAACGAAALAAVVRRYRPDLLPSAAAPRSVYHVLHHEFGIAPLTSSGTLRETPDAKLRAYLARVHSAFKGEVPHVHHETDVFDQIKQSQQKEKHSRNTTDHSVSMYSNAADTDKSHSSYRKKRRSVRPQEEGRMVGGGGRTAGGGARVARLAAELAGGATAAAPRATKPKDLMRSVGKIERDDWNVKEIERKIMENRLGRPEPKTAEKVPKWDREQFLGRQRRLKEGDGSEKWGEIDDTLNKLDQKLRDSGRPDHGTKKVANLATKFVKKEEPEPKAQPKEELKKSWRGPSSTGMQCAACGTRVFAAEGVTADGLHLHRACFRCAVCKCVLRPGNYTMERYGSRLVCLRHSGASVPDAVAAVASLGAVTSLGPSPRALLPPPTPERISLELSDSGAREIDEDEWTDRNFLASETSGAGGLSEEEESSSEEYTDAADSEGEAPRSPPPAPQPRMRHSDLYFSDDSFGYDDYSDDGAESSGNESCSRMRAAREARRREVPADARPPTDSSEVESEESESSDEEVSSGTEVSTDSEFAREEAAPAPSPPAILVTEAPPPAPPPPPPPREYPLSRTRSAGGLATKRALELKRRYLLGEPSPPAVRKSDSTSQLDTKLEAFRSNITEFQKMLHPAPAANVQPKPIVTFQFSTEEKKAQPMPDIIKNLCGDAPVDLLTKVDSPLCKKDWLENTTTKEPLNEEKKDIETEPEPGAEHDPDADLESDSLSDDDSSHTDTAPNHAVPRVEVHNEGGELIQLDSLMFVNSSTEDNDEKASGTATGTTVVGAESSSSESCRDATTLALTETELSDWAAESAVLDDCHMDDNDRKRGMNPRTLSGPKTIHDAKNISAISSHVCGRSSPPQPPPQLVLYSNALEHFEFVDEGEQDPSIETPATPRNEGYMELVDDDDYDPYSPGNDRSINFIERSFSETVAVPSSHTMSTPTVTSSTTADDLQPERRDDTPLQSKLDEQLKTPQLLKSIEKETSEQSSSDSAHKSEPVINDDQQTNNKVDDIVRKRLENFSLSDMSPPLEKDGIEGKSTTVEPPSSIEIQEFKPPLIEETSPPLAPETPKSTSSIVPMPFSTPCTIRLYSPAICRSASETFNRSTSRSTDSAGRSAELSMSINLSSGSVSPVSPPPPLPRDTTHKVQEIKREREEQTEVVRRLVLERLGSGPRAPRKSTRRTRVSPSSSAPPPVPPPPVLPTPPPPPPPPLLPAPPPRPAPPLMPLPVTPSFSDPELARERRRKSIMKSISNYLNRRLGPRHKWHSEPDLTSHEPAQPRMPHASQCAHKSTGALLEAPPVPPPPTGYCPPSEPRPQPLRHPVHTNTSGAASGAADVDERDAMQLWFEARWARLVAQRRAREDSAEPHARRVARLERRLTRPLSAEQQAATVAELVQVSAQREAHQALMAADRRRSGGVGD
ncbi:protein-methionine sulfoxide oxidase mical3b-like isoform X3 [Pectinophora gossypiella]|uniref:protein-methionine sulfoxide oxidase mical3b-like isoform X3 n=1 Tax=Pectinophora gossypiella TaxID=13191 RepID=UPI00214F34CA|nr:protein-methionine sulfoxide oxidase mical3b-like isoform X3 [Pectinophora gossypiella]